MELGQNRVWDYVGDNFVHRLVQTDGSDGKLAEAEGRCHLDNCKNDGTFENFATMLHSGPENLKKSRQKNS